MRKMISRREKSYESIDIWLENYCSKERKGKEINETCNFKIVSPVKV